jgi:hypothetical protein
MIYNWYLGTFVIAVVTAGFENAGRGKSSGSAVAVNVHDR